MRCRRVASRALDHRGLGAVHARGRATDEDCGGRWCRGAAEERRFQRPVRDDALAIQFTGLVRVPVE